MNEPGCPPVIIIGMHRSGTSILCRVLEALGLFVGQWKQWNNESPFFQIINEWLLRRCGATYKTPQPFRATLNAPEVRSATVNRLARLIQSPWVAAYLGWRRYRHYRGLNNLGIPWGWKDPRTTITLSLWLEVFPSAKIIHIFRHGVDVANSLLVRRRRWWNRVIAFCEEIQLRSWRLPDRGASLHTRRLTTLMGGFTLWEEYMEETRAHVRNLGARAMEIKYEDFLVEPHGPLKTLVQFCGLQATDAAIERAIGKIRTQRAYAYRRNSQLKDFADEVQERLRAYGY